jgi:hypothetical protein
MNEFIKYVGLDVHGKTIAVAVADNRSSEIRFVGQIPNTTEALLKLANPIRTTTLTLRAMAMAMPATVLGSRSATKPAPAATALTAD